nr:DUF805 domain-containing protein [Candidatus Kapabacteria bacterium]
FIVSFMDYLMNIGFLAIIYSVAVLVPSIAVGVRRLHDIGKRGWMLIVAFIPIIGWIWLIVLFCLKGSVEDNEFGSNPKASEII